MKLTILGSGSPEPYARRASSGYLIETGDARILFDCGGGVVDNLLRTGRTPRDITHLIFSHLHSDHMMDYARLVHAAWDEGAPPLKVWGPAPIARLTDQLFGRDGVFATDLIARTDLPASQQVWAARGGALPRPWPAPEVTEIAPGDTIDGGTWRIESCEVPHAQPLLTCLGFRLAAGGKSFVYSGDAGICAPLQSLAKDADTLLHWCYRLTGDDVHPAIAELSPTPGAIAAMATNAGARRLVLTHFRVHMDRRGAHEAALAEARALFNGPVRIAEDLDVLQI
ncbi:MAG: MBL fold metallo-hydrolase [Pseudomonadota bacterium]